MVAHELSDTAGLDVCCMEVLRMTQITFINEIQIHWHWKEKHDWGENILEYAIISPVCQKQRCFWPSSDASPPPRLLTETSSFSSFYFLSDCSLSPSPPVSHSPFLPISFPPSTLIPCWRLRRFPPGGITMCLCVHVYQLLTTWSDTSLGGIGDLAVVQTDWP